MESSGKYVIVSLIKGKAKEYHTSLTKKISQEFNIVNVGERIEPHITLKYFNQFLSLEGIKKIESKLQSFCKTHRKARFQLKGISNFDDKVIFIDVVPSQEMRLLYAELTTALESIHWIQWNQFDRENIHFHSTLAEGESLQGKFSKVFSFLSKERPDFDLDLDNICILHKPQDKWLLYKEFKLN